MGFRALHEGAKGGRGDSVYGPGRVRQSQHFHQPVAGGPHQTRHDTVQRRLPANIYSNFPPKYHLFPVDFLIGPSGQIKSAREWYQWIGLSKDMPRYRFLIKKSFDRELLKGVQSLKANTAKVYIITNGLRGRQVYMLLELNSNFYKWLINARPTADYARRFAVRSSEALEYG